MCIVCRTSPSFKSRHRNPKSFHSGPDRRRHVFTAEERRRGGRTSWARTMVQLRTEMNLPIDRHVAQLAEGGEPW